MELQHAIELIRNDNLVQSDATTWADLGCGAGLFTRALAHLLQPGSTVYAVDVNKGALSKIGESLNSIILKKIQADFERDNLPFSDLDGVLMANSLHFVRDKQVFLSKAQKWLKPTGCFLIVEYDTDRANPWVPYPLSFAALCRLFFHLGYGVVEKIGERPSVYHRAAIYSAVVLMNETEHDGKYGL